MVAAPCVSPPCAHPISADILAAANINVRSGLATDYLNHFTEIIMLLELVADMPDMIDDARAWQPKTYAEHFQASHFAARDLAISAYECAPALYRVPFDQVVDELHARIAKGIDEIAAATTSPDTLAPTVAAVVSEIQAMIQRASDLIHGNTAALDQSAVDALFST
ncbi:MAG: hypothetical protein U1E97_13035 [Alphaproteobacteria bacterium]